MIVKSFWLLKACWISDKNLLISQMDYWCIKLHGVGLIQVTNNELLALLGIGIFFLALYYGILRRSWRIWESGFVIVMSLLLIGVIIAAPLEEESKPREPGLPVDHIINITARIKPWTFNITAIDGAPVDASKYVSVEGGAGYGSSVVYNTIELQVGHLYKLVFEAIDTEHGLLVEGLEDYWGEPIFTTLPQYQPEEVYIQPTEADIGEFRFRCVRFCGAGHGEMKAQIVVSA